MRRLALVSGLFALCACATLAELLEQAFEKPKLTFVTARVTGVTLDGLVLETVWRVENPNGVGLSLQRADYRLFVEDKPVMAGSPPLGLTIPANGAAELTFPATVKLAELFPVAQQLAGKDFARYRVEGTVGIDTPVGVLDFPLAYENQFEVPKVPKVELQPPRITRLSFSGTTVEFPISVTNRNGFPLPLTGVSGRLYVGGLDVGGVTLGDQGTLDPRGTKVLKVPLDFDLYSAASAVAAAIQGGREQVRFEAQLQSGESKVPVDVSQLLQFVR